MMTTVLNRGLAPAYVHDAAGNCIRLKPGVQRSIDLPQGQVEHMRAFPGQVQVVNVQQEQEPVSQQEPEPVQHEVDPAPANTRSTPARSRRRERL